MILIINTCAQEMHYLEFVKPIEDILKNSDVSFTTKHYSKVSKVDLDSCHRIIITGTSLKDFAYTKNLSKFEFLKSDNFDKPVLAICGGMQILGLIHGCKLFDCQEIGLKPLTFNAEFLGMKNSNIPSSDMSSGNDLTHREVYCLHNMALLDDEVLHKNFKIYAKSSCECGRSGKFTDAKNTCIQAIKHVHKKHYGVLFHPEVRNKDLIVNFLYI